MIKVFIKNMDLKCTFALLLVYISIRLFSRIWYLVPYRGQGLRGRKMKKILGLGILALFVVGIFAAGAFALPEETKDKMFGKDSKIRTALGAKDYDSWKAAITSKLTKEKFDAAIKKHQDRFTQKAEMDSAIAQGYTAWAKLVENKPIAKIITADNFDKFVKMHNAKTSGDYETAKTIADELGFKPGMGLGNGQGKGMHKGSQQECQQGLHNSLVE